MNSNSTTHSCGKHWAKNSFRETLRANWYCLTRCKRGSWIW